MGVPLAKHADEQTVLVAFTVGAQSAADGVTAHEAQHLLCVLLRPLVGESNGTANVMEWWIAEDDRIDGSDNESAVFVPRDINTVTARVALDHLVLEDCIGIGREGHEVLSDQMSDTDNRFCVDCAAIVGI